MNVVSPEGKGETPVKPSREAGSVSFIREWVKVGEGEDCLVCEEVRSSWLPSNGRKGIPNDKWLGLRLKQLNIEAIRQLHSF
ncbi:hypothetical protein RR48_01085 [Papilio machaon]|uniref:Uncharacterized protein n=1 Tax=Papilio machaon TaxID=76193 RepID=A0A0N1IC89_PAPMA|nr:hypothetical protein RR48_01085 [Papilio machaon]